MRNTSFLQFCGLMVTLITGVYTCDLAAEGEPHEIRYTAPSLPEGVQKVFWFKEDHLIAECFIGSTLCVVIDLRLREAKIERTENGIEFSANVANVSRQHSNNAEGNWILKNDLISQGSQTVYSCLLGVYSKPEQVLCRTTWSTDEVTIKCWTNKIYPEAMMMVRRHGEQPNIISCDNTRTLDDPVYFKAECTSKIPTNDLNFKRNDMDVYIYPNTIGSHSNIGVDIGISIDIDLSAVVVKTCIDRGSYISCSCERLDGDQGKVDVTWLVNDTIKVNRGPHTYRFNKRNGKENSGYIKCQIELHKRINPIIIALAAVTLISTTAAIILLFLCCLKGKPRGLSCPCFRKPPPQSEEIHAIKEATVLIDERNRESHGKFECQWPVDHTNVENVNEFKMIPVILLMGTKNSHKHIIANKLLQRKDKDEREPDNNEVQLDFSHLGSRDIKLVDVPNFNPKDTTKYQENLKSSLCLSPEGYSIFIIVSTVEDVNDTLLMIYMLADEFGKEVINYILVFVMTTQAPGSDYKTNVQPLKDLLDTRCVPYHIEASPDIDETVFGLIDDWSYNYVNYHFKTAYENNRTVGNILFEKIFKLICVLFQRIKNEERFWEDENNLIEIKVLQNNLSDWRNIMNLSTSTLEDLQGILDYFTQGFSKPAVSEKDYKKPLQLAEQSLHSLRFELVKCLLSERQPLIRNSLKWKDIVKKCKRK